MTWLNGAHWNDKDVSSPSDNRQSKPSGNPAIGTLEGARMMLAKHGKNALDKREEALLRDAGELPSGNVVHGSPEHKAMLRAKGMSDD